ncbi:Holliday junction branch migration protein RuvA [Candidatus Roizmanbacteria bacterium]|nr:Holliday junction branch migration protein RuvA [Candidatus Roizmanbacteria bacterium]
MALYITPNILASYKITDLIEFYTYLQVREDAFTLFAFETKEEYSLFDLLLSVSGVGPKTAYLVISYSKVNELVQAIKDNDIDFFSKIRGLGKKTAMKIILELSQKLKQEFELRKMYLSEEDKTVVDALVSLGFKSHEAGSIVSKLPKKLIIEEKIKEALKIIR